MALPPLDIVHVCFFLLGINPFKTKFITEQYIIHSSAKFIFEHYKDKHYALWEISAVALCQKVPHLG